MSTKHTTSFLLRPTCFILWLSRFVDAEVHAPCWSRAAQPGCFVRRHCHEYPRNKLCRFVTYGMKHAKLWERSDAGKGVFYGRACAWAGAAPRDVLCAVFLPSCLHGAAARIAERNQVRCQLCSHGNVHGLELVHTLALNRFRMQCTGAMPV